MSRWFRHYAGMMRDEKLVRAALKCGQPIERVVWVWGAILESASEIDDGGRYEIDNAEISYFLRVDVQHVAAIVSALHTLGRIHKNVVAKWGDRQFQSDRSAERQSRYRQRRKTASDTGGNDTENVTVTSPSRHRDAPETETETEKKDSKSTFEEFTKAYPKRDGGDSTKAARQKFDLVVRDGADPAEIAQGAKLYATEQARLGNAGTKFVKQRAVWLGQELWKDYLAKSSGSALAKPMIWLLVDDPRWCEKADAWAVTHGGKPPPKIAGMGGMGWHFPAEIGLTIPDILRRG